MTKQRLGHKSAQSKLSGEHASMAHSSGLTVSFSPEFILLDSESTSNLVPHVAQVKSKLPCRTRISLEDQKVESFGRTKRSMHFCTMKGVVKLSLFRTLVVPYFPISQLSVFALVRKENSILPFSAKAMLFDSKTEMKVLQYAVFFNSSLFHIPYNVSTTVVNMTHRDPTKGMAMKVVPAQTMAVKTLKSSPTLGGGEEYEQGEGDYL